MGGERRGGRREPRKIRPGGMSKSRRRLERVVDSEWIMVEEKRMIIQEISVGVIYAKKSKTA
jgi:hypothetical protein